MVTKSRPAQPSMPWHPRSSCYSPAQLALRPPCRRKAGRQREAARGSGIELGLLMLIDENRLFPADPTARAIARRLYDGVKDLPIVSPHGHTDPRWYADDAAVPRPGDALRRARPLHFPHALQPGRAARGARHPAARRQPRPRPIRARSGACSPSTTICSAARRRGSGSTMSSPTLFGFTERLSAADRRRLFRPHQRSARPAGIPAARAVRALQHRGDRDDREPARSACRITGRSANPAGTGASSPPIGPIPSSIPSSKVFAATSSASAS